MDATYRADLRELNELNFQRFDAKLEQRLVELDAKWEQRLTQIEARWEGRLAQIEARWEGRLAQLDKNWERRLGDLRTEMVRWMFVFWTGTVVTLGALVVTLRVL